MNPALILDKLVQRHPTLQATAKDIERAFELMKNCFFNGHVLYTCGNGGSAADSEHIVGELVKGFIKPRKLREEETAALREHCDDKDAEYLAGKLEDGLPAIALTGHPALATAVGNDTAPDLAFAQQIHVFGRSGDLLLAISTSGNARNVVLAAQVAKVKGMSVIGLTGLTGGKLYHSSDVCICVPEEETYLIQEYHMPVYHALCAMLESSFF